MAWVNCTTNMCIQGGIQGGMSPLLGSLVYLYRPLQMKTRSLRQHLTPHRDRRCFAFQGHLHCITDAQTAELRACPIGYRASRVDGPLVWWKETLLSLAHLVAALLWLAVAGHFQSIHVFP